MSNSQQQHQNEEDAVLATLHASLQDQSTYEEEVIRGATHAMAPSLPLTLGFPSLESLSNTGTVPVPLVHEMLEQVRRQQQTSDDMAAVDVACCKEQMLLHYLETVCGVKQAKPGGIPSVQEQRRVDRRKQRTRTQQTAANPKRDDDDPSSAMPSPPRAAKRRKVQHIVNQEEDPVQLDAKTRRALAQRRLERQQRKAARRQHKLSATQNSDDEVEFEAPNEEEDDDDEKKQAAVDQSTTQAVASKGDSVDDAEGDAAAVATNDMNDSTLAAGNTAEPLVCPLCSETVETDSSDAVERDALLAQHMQHCQSGSGRRRRRSTARKTTRTPIEGAKDVESDIQAAAPRTTRSKKSTKATTKTTIPRARAPPMDDLDEIDYEDRVDDWIEAGLSHMKEMKERVDTGEEDVGDAGPWQEYGNGYFVPAWIHRRLFGYQREGLQWMWGLHQQGCGGCLGDEMGLGKTVSVSAYLGSLAANRKIKSVLIVVPATMLQHWLKELAIWAPGLRRIIIHSSGESDGRSRSISPYLLKSLSKWLQQSRKDRLYEAIDEEDEASHPPHSFCGTGYAILTTYENVRRNPDVYVAHRWSYVVLDEAQKLKNPEADVTVTMKRLRTPHRIAMSGTPIQNDLNELWSLFDFCFPSRLGTLPAFQQELADPIKRGGYSNATPMQVQMAYRCALVVRDLVSPYLLRRTKKEVKEVALMPKKTEHVLFCRLSETQRALYESYLRSEHVVKVMRGSANLLGAITMLRKICNHPDLVCAPGSVESLVENGFNLTSNNYSYESESSDEDDGINGDSSMIQRSGKLEVLSKILPLWKKQGHKVLIFCQWRKMLNLVELFVSLQGWKFGRLDGNTNVAARQRLVDNFNQDDSYFCLLCTTRTGGVGLNLTGANRIILYDPGKQCKQHNFHLKWPFMTDFCLDWNPQTDAQARERAWRFGQENEVTVYRLITAGTVEEKIYHRQIFKTALSNRVLQDPRQRRLFSQRDLRDLFTLRADTGSVRAGGHGSTETAEYTQGIGVVDPNADVGRDTDENDEEAKDDNEDTLKTVMQSKGLAGVFDHNFIEQDASRKSTTVREMEEKAKEVARAAMAALRQSVADEQGPEESQRFGGGGITKTDSSSKSLLASLRQRQAAASGASTEVDEETKKYTKILTTLREYVRRKRPSTDEILAHFNGSAVSSEPAVFRRLLKSVAVLQNGQWMLKK